MDGDIVRLLVAADTFSHAAAGDRISRVHRQIPRRAQAVHQAAAGPLRGKSRFFPQRDQPVRFRIVISCIPMRIARFTTSHFSSIGSFLASRRQEPFLVHIAFFLVKHASGGMLIE